MTQTATDNYGKHTYSMGFDYWVIASIFARHAHYDDKNKNRKKKPYTDSLLKEETQSDGQENKKKYTTQCYSKNSGLARVTNSMVLCAYETEKRQMQLTVNRWVFVFII